MGIRPGHLCHNKPVSLEGIKMTLWVFFLYQTQMLPLLLITVFIEEMQL